MTISLTNIGLYSAQLGSEVAGTVNYLLFYMLLCLGYLILNHRLEMMQWTMSVLLPGLKKEIDHHVSSSLSPSHSQEYICHTMHLL